MEEKRKVIKVIAIVGPTASGKSNLAIQLAKKFNGEIINADSRQIYKLMDIGTAKDPDDDSADGKYTVQGIPIHLIDFITPDETFSVAEFQKLAIEKIAEIGARGKIPFLVGGTGLWVDAVCKEYTFLEGKAFEKLRQDLSKKNVDELFRSLEELNPGRANTLNESDRRNPRRLIRAIEKEMAGITPLNQLGRENSSPDTCAEVNRSKGRLGKIECLYLSPKIDFPTLEKRIYNRVDKMLEQGLLEENKKLLEMRYHHNLPSMSGIGYKEFENYFKGGKTLNEVKEEIKLHTRQYAKRQMTWFKKNEEIRYVDFEEAEKEIEKYLVIFNINNYPKSFGNIKKGGFRLRRYLNSDIGEIKRIEHNLWQFCLAKSEENKPNKTYKQHKFVDFGWEWSVFRKNHKLLIKIPAEIFKEVNTKEYLDNTKFAYNKILEYFPRKFIAKTKFFRKNSLNIIEQEYLIGKKNYKIGYNTKNLRLLQNLKKFLQYTTKMLENYHWLPDFDIKKERGGFVIRNVIFTEKTYVPKIIDFTAYYDVYRMHPERLKFEIKEKGDRIKIFADWANRRIELLSRP